ncbi:hypothetical protein RZS08_31655, partial [Arthrospira platensis SPKY1]|nr:hypothetical protein [Arthrospira platensis SPKY1]
MAHARIQPATQIAIEERASLLERIVYAKIQRYSQLQQALPSSRQLRNDPDLRRINIPECLLNR